MLHNGAHHHARVLIVHVLALRPVVGAGKQQSIGWQPCHGFQVEVETSAAPAMRSAVGGQAGRHCPLIPTNSGRRACVQTCRQLPSGSVSSSAPPHMRQNLNCCFGLGGGSAPAGSPSPAAAAGSRCCRRRCCCCCRCCSCWCCIALRLVLADQKLRAAAGCSSTRAADALQAAAGTSWRRWVRMTAVMGLQRWASQSMHRPTHLIMPGGRGRDL